jgi:Acetyltransferase (GNAT) domain
MSATSDPSDDAFESHACRDAEELRALLSEWAPALDLFDAAPSICRAVLPDTQPWIFRLGRSERPESVVAGLARRGRWQRGLVLVATAASGLPGRMLDHLHDFARAHRLSNVMLEWIGSASLPPTLERERQRRVGDTFIVPLDTVDPERPTSKNQRRNVRRARESGVDLVNLARDEAIEAHLAVCRSSLDRRAGRGETIEASLRPQVFEALVSSDRGRLYQMGLGGRPLASDMIIRIGDAAWYFSGGTSSEGMRTGASHLLMFEIIRDLRESGCRRLNLGFTETAALARFKAGFGAQRIPMARVRADWGSPVQRVARWVASRMRH